MHTDVCLSAYINVLLASWDGKHEEHYAKYYNTKNKITKNHNTAFFLIFLKVH